MNLRDVLDIMIEQNASDVFLRPGGPLWARIYTNIKVAGEDKFSVEDVNSIIFEMMGDDKNKKELLKKNRNYELSIWHGERWRFRVGIFYQRNSLAAVIRKIDLNIPSFSELNLPEKVVENFCHERRGIVLLTGITGSGKSTTIASMIEYINNNLGKHILTIEEPIEFIFSDKKSLINQREIGKDVESYADALRQFALHSPDVIYIGNIRDYETCKAALTAAETGVFVLSTLHTVNASSTVERIVDFFPPHQQHLVLNQLSVLLKGVVSQRLIPRIDTEGVIPACETMVLSPTISRLLRENKSWEIPKYMASGGIYGMRTFNQCLVEFVKDKKISPESALENSDKKEDLELQLRNKGLL